MIFLQPCQNAIVQFFGKGAEFGDFGFAGDSGGLINAAAAFGTKP